MNQDAVALADVETGRTARTEPVRKLSSIVKRGLGLPLYRPMPHRLPVVDHQRPKTRGECVDGPRPCPYVSCRYHLALSVKNNGAILFYQQGVDVADMEESCALDVADRGGLTQASIGALLGLCRERIRQIEVDALRNLEGSALQRFKDGGDE